ncbi:MAG: hypothetical protein K6A63_05510 [Acholeplasmatales bacterium]|nr:hypothetical protein [Acholeplasmatales bacterium]
MENNYDVFIAYHGTNSKEGSYDLAKAIANYLIENDIFPFVCNYCGLYEDRNIPYHDTLSVVSKSDLFLLVVNDEIKTRLNRNGAIGNDNGEVNDLEREMNQFARVQDSKKKSNCVCASGSDLKDKDFQNFNPLLNGHKEMLIGACNDFKDILDWVKARKKELMLKPKNYNKADYIFKNKLEIGSTIQFGEYKYYLDGTKKQMEWVVLDKIEDGYLIQSKKVIDKVPFIFKNKDTIIEWLNKNFYNEAFNSYEKEHILNKYGSNVFILSKEEIEKYYSSDNLRKKEITPFALNSQQLYSNHHRGNTSCYWTSTRGNSNTVYCVEKDGRFDTLADMLPFIGVAPAIIINL